MITVTDVGLFWFTDKDNFSNESKEVKTKIGERTSYSRRVADVGTKCCTTNFSPWRHLTTNGRRSEKGNSGCRLITGSKLRLHFNECIYWLIKMLHSLIFIDPGVKVDQWSRLLPMTMNHNVLLSLTIQCCAP